MRAQGQVSGHREGEELGPLGPEELITLGPRLCEEERGLQSRLGDTRYTDIFCEVYVVFRTKIDI